MSGTLVPVDRHHRVVVRGADAADDGLNEGLSSSLTKGLTDVFGLRGYAVGYVVQQAAALCSQVRDLDATCDSDPSLSPAV